MANNYEQLVVKDNYEVSIWDDVYDTSNKRFTEEKIAVIGSNTMTAQTRIIDPTLTENTNGTKTLTFSIYYRYIDSYEGIEKINPFIKLLLVERKIKLHWKGEWYDFIIKQRVESSDKHSFIYTCESLAANELTKTGYHLEFDTELCNNTDTIWNLAQTVLDGTDWRLPQDHSTVFRETVTEAGYKVAVSPTLNSQSYILLFYNTVFTAQNKTASSGSIMFQAWVGDLEDADDKGVLQTGFCLTDNTTGHYSISGGTTSFTFKYNGTTYSCSCTSSQQVYTYRAKRDILQQLSVFSPPLNRYVGKYNYNGSTILGYTTADYVAPDVVSNLIINDKDFSKTDGWFNVDEFTIYPIYDASQQGFDVETYNPKGYLLASNSHTKVGNNCFLHNASYMPDGLVAGDKLIVKLKVGSATYNTSTGKYTIASTNISTTASINKYTQSGTTYTPSTAAADVYGSVSLTSSGGYLTGELTLTKTLSRSDLLTSSVALFFNFNTSLSTNQYYAIEEAQLYFKKTDSQGNIITPNSVDASSVITYTTKYFSQSDNNPGKTEDDINWLYIGTSHTDPESSQWSSATPILDDTCEKIRTINGKNSTRYNWLQTLAETFEVWCRFWVDHNADGTIAYETVGGVSVPRKFVTFVDRIGSFANYGFVYGIDLKSIQRTIDSNTLATKIIVPQNSNEYATDGFCTIQRSSENYSGENYILNFDYYCDNGLIDRGRLYTDLYESYDASTYATTGNLGYYQRLHQLNAQYDARADEIVAVKNDIDKQKAYLNVYDDLCDSTVSQIASINSQITALVSVDQDGNATGYNSSNVEAYMRNNPEWQKLIDLYKTRGECQRAVTVYSNMVTSLQGSIATLTTQLESLEDAQEANREARQAIVDEFNKRYSRYIQEGTWQSEDYVDDTKYYLDGQAVAYTSARPKLTYNIQVIRLSALDDYKNKEFKLGDISWVEDEEFFMARYREEVVVTQVISHMDMPENDSITVQNYRTQFQDLFQRTESTIQSFQYGEGSYNNVASIMESDGTINVVTLQNSIAANNFLMNQSGLNNSVTTGPEGITVTDLTNISNKVRITANGIFISTDGGANWINAIKGSGISTDALSAGAINVKDITINGSQGNTFRWDDKGITAYYFDSQNQVINTAHYVRIDRFGIYGILNDDNFASTTEQSVFDNAAFGMTWDRFFMKNRYGTHYVEVSSTNDIRVVDTSGNTESERIRIGRLSSDPAVYGIRISDNNANTVMETNSDGTLWIKHVLNIGTTSSGRYLASLGYLPYVSNSAMQIKWREGEQDEVNLDTRTITGTSSYMRRVFDIGGTSGENSTKSKFVVWEDGTLYARDGYFQGTINATSGHFTGEITATSGTIGGVSVGTVAALPGQLSNLSNTVDELKSFNIESEAGYTFTVDTDDTVSPTAITLTATSYGFTIPSANSVTWFGTTDIEGQWASFGTGLTKTFTYPITVAGVDIFDTVNTYYIKATCNYNSQNYTAYVAFNKVKNGELPIVLEITSSSGTIFINNNINTTLTATVTKGASDITSQYSGQFYWYKDGVAFDPTNHTNTITVTNTDVNQRAVFTCTVGTDS